MTEQHCPPPPKDHPTVLSQLADATEGYASTGIDPGTLALTHAVLSVAVALDHIRAILERHLEGDPDGSTD
jgi:hypothetical protein